MIIKTHLNKKTQFDLASYALKNKKSLYANNSAHIQGFFIYQNSILSRNKIIAVQKTINIDVVIRLLETCILSSRIKLHDTFGLLCILDHEYDIVVA